MPEATFTLVYDDVPKSVNAGGGGSRKHKYASHREKMEWEGIFAMLFVTQRIPRPLGFTRLTIELQFTVDRGRDAENYRHPIVKPLLDAMKKGGWIADDTEEFVQVERVYLDDEPLRGVGPLVKSRMTITVQTFVPA